MSSLYRDTILYYYKHPQHFGTLDNPTHHGTAHNPLCGDTLTLQLIVKDDIINNVAWKGDGCAISQASMSLFADYILNKNIADALSATHETLFGLLGARVTSGREKCALLPLSVLHTTFSNL